MKILQSFLATTVMLTMAAISPALAQKVQILGANYGGSGCPDNSASVSVSPDGQELSMRLQRQEILELNTSLQVIVGLFSLARFVEKLTTTFEIV